MTTFKTEMFQSLKSKRKFKSRENKQDTIMRVNKLLDINAKLRKIRDDLRNYIEMKNGIQAIGTTFVDVFQFQFIVSC